MLGPLILALSWTALIFVIVAGTGLIVAQWLLPRAREAIKEAPPLGPGWARQLWYDQQRLYGAILSVALTAGLVAGLISLFSAP